ncbi:hypothetical protein BE221DRAFT_67155 [Ostreococcus tauri]|uniref:Uncharacterized protein n=1 Tax=Ostreococcus tauri TaxID=70448 RepID=A0A1Y5IJM3_OSTTA|nr:hypothetical protein BE221DRAFT_67155 [Ostreococcus tauri]
MISIADAADPTDIEASAVISTAASSDARRSHAGSQNPSAFFSNPVVSRPSCSASHSAVPCRTLANDRRPAMTMRDSSGSPTNETHERRSSRATARQKTFGTRPLVCASSAKRRGASTVRAAASVTDSERDDVDAIARGRWRGGMTRAGVCGGRL